MKFSHFTKKIKIALIVLLFLPCLVFADYQIKSDDIRVKTTDFSGNLSSADNTVQKALETIDGLYISSITYPGAGIPLSTGSAWGTSITNNSANWNTAYSWGNHASAGYESTSNKVSSLSGSSTDAQYPGAKLVYDQLAGKQATLSEGTDYLTKTHLDAAYLGITATAADSAKLNGQSASYYYQASNPSGYISSLSGAVLIDQTTGQTIGNTNNRLTKLWATDITATNPIVGSVTGNAGTVTNATLTTPLTNNGGAGILTWPAAGATLGIPEGGGTLGSAAFTASTAYDVAGAAAAVTPTSLGLVIGTNVQAYDADLTTWGGITPGTGVGTFLATPSSANLASALTDKTGTGYTVFSDSPVFTTKLTCPVIIGGTTTTSDLSLQTTSGVGATGADMHFLVGNNGATEAMTILNSGNVGIGTTSPDVKLRVEALSDGSNINLLTLSNPFMTANTETTMRFAPTSDPTVRYAAISGVNVGSNNVDLKFTTGAGATITEKMRIKAGGNVGIGTTSPAYKLDVSGDIRATGTIYGASGTQVPVGTGTENYLSKWSASGTLGDSVLYDDGANVGIGTTGPGARLHVVGSDHPETIGDSPTLLVQNGAGANDLAEIGLGHWANYKYVPTAIGQRATSWSGYTKGDLYFATRDVTTDTAPTERMIITSAGNVGIGTTDLDGTPTIGRLTVKGTTNDGTTNIFVGRDSDEANVFTIDTNGLATGTFSGSLTGNVTGNVSGSSGSCTGNAATVTNGVYTTDIGSTVQAYDADLTTWAGITPGANVGTFLATPSSANLSTAVTDETGSGALVFGTSPVFTTQITSPKIYNAGDMTIDAYNAASDSTVTITNSDGTYDANLSIDGDLTVKNILVQDGGVLQLGYDTVDGELRIYSEQGVTDYIAHLFANTAMTSAANFYLPADEPASTQFLTMTSGGAIGFDTLGFGALSDPDANTILGWDDTDGAMKTMTIGTGLAYDHATHTISSTVGATALDDIADPDAATSISTDDGENLTFLTAVDGENFLAIHQTAASVTASTYLLDLGYNADADTEADFILCRDDLDGTPAEMFKVEYNGDITTAGAVVVGAAGVKLSSDGDGAITFLGLGNGYDEDLTINLDDTENTAVVSSSTGVTKIDAGNIIFEGKFDSSDGTAGASATTGGLTFKDGLYTSGTATEYATKGANSDITSLSGLTTALSVAQGGTGQATAQAAINALTNVSAATNEHVLTKDTATGNAIFKAASGGANTALSNLADVAINTTLKSDTDNTDDLGASDKAWKDAYIKGAIGVSGASITNGVTATTQSAGDNSTKLATTAYVDGGLLPKSYELIAKSSASNSASIAFSSIPHTYSQLKLVINSIVPTTNAVNLMVQISTGSGILTSNYLHGTFRWTNAGSGVDGSASDSSWVISSNNEKLGTGENQIASFEVTIFDANLSNDTKRSTWLASGIFASATMVGFVGNGYVLTNSAPIDGVTIKCSSGNISSGDFYLYGVKE